MNNTVFFFLSTLLFCLNILNLYGKIALLPPGPSVTLASLSEDQKNKRRSNFLKNNFENHVLSSRLPFMGNATGKKLVWLFTDPYCHVCPKAMERYRAHTKNDPELKVVIVTHPIGGKHSLEASRALVAAHILSPGGSFQEKFRHKVQQKETNKSSPFLSKEELAEIAKEDKIDPEKFRKLTDGKSMPGLRAEILKTALALCIDATPTFVLFDQGRIVFSEGFVPPEELLSFSEKCSKNQACFF